MTPAAANPARSPGTRASPRPVVDGKFFRVASQKFYVKGITYGPFKPGPGGEGFPSQEQTRSDFELITELGANVIRVYQLPPHWLLSLAAEHNLKLFIDIPWPGHLCFLDSPSLQLGAIRTVREAVESFKDHPAVFAYNLANEIPADVVRWSGVRDVNRFIERLIDEAKAADPNCLCAFTSFPPTEFLRADNADFLCFNVYLHHQKPFENYLARLQMLAGSKPLVLGEFGSDSIRHGEAGKSELLKWQIESAFRSGAAGAVLFSFTDDWFRGGHQIEDWQFGVTTREREPKPSFAVVQAQFQKAPYYSPPRTPKVSAVVATYNGARTLKSCLDALSRLNYPDYEVIVVDDGSTDATPEIAQRYTRFRYIRQSNRGLSSARNAGIAAATGEIVAFTDSDCRPDEDWLYYLIGDLLTNHFHGIGGHNFLPPEDSPAAAAVMASPGGPAHVMLTDREAEHVPGCNMAFFRWVLIEIGAFDPVFRKAGDDVDVCWRVRELGYHIGFSPAGFVWHYRRANVAAYLRQQSGYGEAEALLARKHPEYFNFFGVSIWHGRIYSAGKHGVILQRPVIYHGMFGSGFFQKLYTPEPAGLLMLLTSLEYHAFVTLPLLVLSAPFSRLLPVAIASFMLSVAVCITAATQADIPKNRKRFWSRPLVALMFFLQPIVRGWARYRWRWNVQSAPRAREQAAAAGGSRDVPEALSFFHNASTDRIEFLRRLLQRLDAEGWENKPDAGWGKYDVEIFGNRWSRLRLTTVTEELPEQMRITRCRLDVTWSLRAMTGFWLVAALELVAIGLFARVQHWIWMLLLSLPVLSWFLEFEKRWLQQQVALMIRELAGELGWKAVAGGKGTGTTP